MKLFKTGTLYHTTMVTAPVIMPIKAPVFVVFFHSKDSMSGGPNVAAKPPHA